MGPPFLSNSGGLGCLCFGLPFFLLVMSASLAPPMQDSVGDVVRCDVQPGADQEYFTHQAPPIDQG